MSPGRVVTPVAPPSGEYVVERVTSTQLRYPPIQLTAEQLEPIEWLLDEELPPRSRRAPWRLQRRRGVVLIGFWMPRELSPRWYEPHINSEEIG